MHVGPCFAVTRYANSTQSMLSYLDLYESGPLSINVFEENKVVYRWKYLGILKLKKTPVASGRLTTLCLLRFPL